MEDVLVEEYQVDLSAENLSSAQGVCFNNGSFPEVTVKHHMNGTQESVSTGEEAREPVTTSHWNVYNNGNEDIEDSVQTFYEASLNSHNGVEVVLEDLGGAEEQLLREDLGMAEVDWQSHLDGSERVNPKDNTSVTHLMPVNFTEECLCLESTDTTYLESAGTCTCRYPANVEQMCTTCENHSSLKLNKDAELTRTVDGCSSSTPVINNNIPKPLVRVYDTASDNDIIDSDDLNCFQEPDSPSDTVIVTIKISASLKGLVLETTTGFVAARKNDSYRDGIDVGSNGSRDIEHKGETSDKQVVENQTSDVDDDNKDGDSKNHTVPQRVRHMPGVIMVNSERITHILNARLCNEEANEAMDVRRSERSSSSSDDETRNGNIKNDSIACADKGNNSEVDKQTFLEAEIHPLSKSLKLAEIEACDDMQKNSNVDGGLYCSQLDLGQINECSRDVNCDSYRTLTDPSKTDSLLRSNSFDLKFHIEDYSGTDHNSPCTTLVLEDADITNTHSVCTDRHAVNAKENNASDEREDGEISYIKVNCKSSSLFDGSMNTNKSEPEETVVVISEHQIDKHDMKVDSMDGESSSTSSPNNCNCSPEENMFENSCSAIYMHKADNSVGMTDTFRQTMLHSCALVLKPEVDVYFATEQDDNEIKIDEDRQEEDVDTMEAYQKSQRTRKKRSLVLEVISDFEGTSGNEIDNTIDLSPDMELSQEETKSGCSVCQPENHQTTSNLLADDSNPDRSVFDIRSIFTSERSQDGTPPEEIMSDCDESEKCFAANRWFGCLSSSSLEVENSSDFESAIEDNISNIGTESYLDTDDVLSVSSSESCGMYPPESSKSSDFESAAEDSIWDQSRSISNNSAMCKTTRNPDIYHVAQVDDAFGARIVQSFTSQSASNSNALSNEDTFLEFDNGSIPVQNVDLEILKDKEACKTFGMEAEENRSQSSEIEPDKVDISDEKCQLASQINEELDFGEKCASPCHSEDEIKCNANIPIPMVNTLMQCDDGYSLLMSESQTFANVQSVIQTDTNKAIGSNSNLAMVEASNLSQGGTTANAQNDDMDMKNVDSKSTVLKKANTINFEKIAPLKWKTLSILDNKKGTQSPKQELENGEKKQIQAEKTIKEKYLVLSLIDYNQARGETFCKESVAETKQIPDSSDRSETVERCCNSFKGHLNWKSLEKSPVDVEMVLDVEKEKCKSETDEIIVNNLPEGKHPLTESQFLAKDAIVLASPVKLFDEGFLILDAADKTKLQLGVLGTKQPQREDDLPTAPRYFRGLPGNNNNVYKMSSTQPFFQKMALPSDSSSHEILHACNRLVTVDTSYKSGAQKRDNEMLHNLANVENGNASSTDLAKMLADAKDFLNSSRLDEAEMAFMHLYQQMQEKTEDNGITLVHTLSGLADICIRRSRMCRSNPLEWQWLCMHAIALLQYNIEFCDSELENELDNQETEWFQEQRQSAELKCRPLEDNFVRALYNSLKNDGKFFDPFQSISLPNTPISNSRKSAGIFPLSTNVPQYLIVTGMHYRVTGQGLQKQNSDDMDTNVDWLGKFQEYCRGRLQTKNFTEVTGRVLKSTERRHDDDTESVISNDSHHSLDWDHADLQGIEEIDEEILESDSPVKEYSFAFELASNHADNEGWDFFLNKRKNCIFQSVIQVSQTSHDEDGHPETTKGDHDLRNERQRCREKEIISPLHEHSISLTLSRSFCKLADKLVQEEEYAKAEMVYEKILDLIDEIQDGTAGMLRFSARIMKNLGTVKSKQGKSSSGLAFLNKALQTYRDLQEEEANFEIAIALIELGNGHIVGKNNEDSVFEDVIVAICEFFEKDCTDTSTSTSSAGSNKSEMTSSLRSDIDERDIEEAIMCYNEAISLLNRYQEDEKQIEMTAKAIMRLGDCHFMQKNYDRALECFERSLGMFKANNIFGKDSLMENAHVLCMLGVSSFMLHVYPRAASVFEMALHMVKCAYGYNRTFLHGLLLSLLGISQYKMKNCHKCVSMCYQAFEVFCDLFGEELAKLPRQKFWLVCQTLYVMGNSYNTLNLQQKGIKYLTIARSLMKASKCRERRQFMRVLQILGDCYFALYDYKTALQFYNEALEYGECESQVSFDEVFDPNLASDEMTMHNHLVSKSAEAHISMQQYQNAVSYLEQAHDIQEVMGEDIKEDLINTLNQLGQMHSMAGDVEKAIDSYKESLEVYREIHDGKLGPEMCPTLGNLAAICYVKACISDQLDEELEMILTTEQYFQEALNLEMNQEVCVKYANFLYSQTNYEDAVMYLEDALKIDKTTTDIVYGGLEKVTLPDLLQDEVEAQDEICLPSTCLARYLLVLCNKCLRLERIAERHLIDLMEEVLDYDIPLLHSLLGYAMMELRLFEEASRCFMTAADMEDDYQLAKENCAICLIILVQRTWCLAIEYLWDYGGLSKGRCLEY